MGGTEIGDVGAVDLAGEDRIKADDQERQEDDDGKPFLDAGRSLDAAMLDREDDEHQDAADDEGGVKVGLGEERNVEGDQRPVADRRRQGRDRIAGQEGGDCVLRCLAGIGRKPFPPRAGCPP